MFKTNGIERLRLKSGGAIQLAGFTGNSLLRLGTGGNLQEFPELPIDDRRYPYWTTAGNTVGEDQSAEWLGTINNKDLKVKTNSILRYQLTKEGRLVWGSATESNAPFIITEQGHLGLGTTTALDAPLSIKRTQGDWVRFKRTASDGSDDGYWTLHNGDATQNHLAFHYIPAMGDALLNRLVLWNDGKVSIGNVSTNTDGTYVYGLYVEKGILTERLKVAIKTEADWSDYVLQPGYALMSLEELAKFVDNNPHLPNVPRCQGNGQRWARCCQNRCAAPSQD